MSRLVPPLGRDRARSLFAGLPFAGLFLALAVGPAWGQGFAGRWEPTLGTGPCAEVRASVMFDLDGNGPVPVVGTGLTPRVLAKRGTQWVPVGAPFSSARINALVVFDPDGDGPLLAQLIVGGEFSWVGTATPNLVENVNRVARWNGTAWVPMGQGLSDEVYALAVYDPDGPGPQSPQLIAGGRFLFPRLSGVQLNGIARWDGTAWQPLGSGVSGSGEVRALCVFDADGGGPMPPKLIAGGTFATAGGSAASNIAAWDGSSWSPLGGGVAGATGGGAGVVSALLADDPDGDGPQPMRLVVGGSFTTAGGAQARGIAQWDGSAWLPLGTDDLTSVFALSRFDPDGNGPLPPMLIAGKDRAATSPGTAGCVIAWDGAAWQPLGGGVDTGSAKTLLVDAVSAGNGNRRLIAGGSFKTAGGVLAPTVAQWDGLSWQRIASERSGETVGDGTVIDFDGSGPAPSQLVTLGNGLLAWSGGEWQQLSGPIEAGLISQNVGVADSGTPGGLQRLVAGGTVIIPDEGPVGRLYEFSPPGWQQVGPPGVGLSSSIMFDFDGPGPGAAQLVVADRRGVYRQDGAGWQQLGGLTAGASRINTLASFDPDGPGPQPAQLIAAGTFTSLGGVNLNNVARWDGAAWQPLGTGLGGSVSTLAAYDADGDGPLPALLIAGGDFVTIAGPSGGAARRLAQWDGTSWQEFGGGAGLTVRSLVVNDPDENGPRSPELYAAGQFITIGGAPIVRIARWDGIRWHPVGDGVDSVFDLLIYTPPGGAGARLVALGPTVAGPWAVPSVAMLSPRSSPADTGSTGGVLGPDGVLDNNDFVAFIDLFFANDGKADIGRAGGLPGADGQFDSNDFIAFIQFYFAG